MRIAFYAPLKPPTHPVPSGDRRIARLLLAALARAGHDVRVVSTFRAYEGAGDPARQDEIRRAAATVEKRLRGGMLARWKPDLWFTYHLYHKAPDWLGPPLAAALRIPYVIAEAAYAPRRSAGRWPEGLAAVESAVARADMVVFLNPVDSICIRPLMRASAKALVLDPFLDQEPFAAARRRREAHRARLARRWQIPAAPPWLLAVAMMRAGDKLASYRVLAAALARIEARPWHLIVVGTGEANCAVKALFRGFSARVHFVGAVRERELPPVYAAADLLVWPAMNEAIGQAVLEAQASGMAAVAGRAGALAAIVADGETGLLVREGDADAFASAVAALLDDPARRARMCEAAAGKVRARHDLARAAEGLDRALAALGTGMRR
jgi:glycosyltransferase involved in cell wall biosynthesis